MADGVFSNRGTEDDVFDVDVNDSDASPSKSQNEPAPEYRIYSGSRIAISSSVGKVWQKKMNAAIAAYEAVTLIWDQVFQYYNNSQSKSMQTPRGVFKRGDGTENVLFSNLNIMLPAVYSKDPDITCSTIDESEEPFCKSLEKLLNTLIRSKQGLNAKPKIKKAVGIGLLTNFGILALDYTKKDDSREIAMQEMQSITDALAKAKTQEDVELLYGKLEALEMNMEVMKPNGPSLRNVLPHNLIVDPFTENQDGTDAGWMIERVYLPTAMLTARYTKPDSNSDENNLEGSDGGIRETSGGARVLIYKPTHKASFNTADGRRDDGLGLVMQAIESASQSTHHTADERTAYINLYSTECYLVWDKVTRRVMLFQRDDWSWPLWVWDDPLVISRFFPYYIIGYTMSTGGTVAVGETAYYLDQQDEINDINRKLSRMRSSVFDYFFYNSDVTDSDQIEKMLKAIRGEGGGGNHIVGIKAGERKLSDIVESITPRMDQYKELFDKQGLLDAINRITNTSDALRGVQFKTNTNEDAINTYQESMKLSVGAKVDVVEDVVADIAISLAELCIQNMTKEDVQNVVGANFAQAWKQMTVQEFNATYNLEIVAGSMEKPNSVFKKKEAIQIAQAVGQFAQAAPGATLTIMLRVLQQAFTEVVIKPEDWQMLGAEIQSKTGAGVSAPTGSAQAAPGAPGANPGAPGASGGVSPNATGQPPGPIQQLGTQQPGVSQTQPGQVPPGVTGGMMQLLQSLPPQAKQEVIQLYQQGKSPQEIMELMMQHLHGGAQGNVQPMPQPPQAAPAGSTIQ